VAELALWAIDDGLLQTQPCRPPGVYLVKLPRWRGCSLLDIVRLGSRFAALKSTTSTPLTAEFVGVGHDLMVEETLITRCDRR